MIANQSEGLTNGNTDAVAEATQGRNPSFHFDVLEFGCRTADVVGIVCSFVPCGTVLGCHFKL